MLALGYAGSAPAVRLPTDLTTALRERLPDGHGVQWSDSVERAAAELAPGPRTSKGELSFSSPRPGGVHAWEYWLLPFMIDAIMKADLGAARIFPSMIRRYDALDVPGLAPMAARADEQRHGQHLQGSGFFDNDGFRTCKFAHESLLGIYSGVFATNPGLQEAAGSFNSLTSAGVSQLRIWFGCVVTDAESAVKDAEARTPSSDRKKSRAPDRKQLTRALVSTLSTARKNASVAALAAFFLVMTRWLMERMNAHQKKEGAGRATDGGMLKAFCACGSNITQASQQLARRETQVAVADLVLALVNHPTNLVVYDNACLHGLAGHMPNRVPALLDGCMGGIPYRGAAVPLEPIEAYFGTGRRTAAVQLPWLFSHNDREDATFTAFYDVVVVLYVGHSPTFERGNVMTGRPNMFFAIDRFHSSKCNHPSHQCGAYFLRMIDFGTNVAFDSAAAERAWSDLLHVRGFRRTMRPGTLAFLREAGDDYRCCAKVYGLGDKAPEGALQERLKEGRLHSGCALAYDSAGRWIFVCKTCGLPPTCCVHTGGALGWHAVVSMPTLPRTEAQGPGPTVYQGALARVLPLAQYPGVGLLTTLDQIERVIILADAADAKEDGCDGGASGDGADGGSMPAAPKLPASSKPAAPSAASGRDASPAPPAETHHALPASKPAAPSAASGRDASPAPPAETHHALPASKPAAPSAASGLLPRMHLDAGPPPPGVSAAAWRELNVSRAVLSRLGLPPAHTHVHEQESTMQLPQWLLQAQLLLQLRARVVDYLPSARATNVCSYLRSLGFEAELDTAGRQVGNTCGVVAAWVAVDLKQAHLRTPGDWMSTNSADRFDPQMYRQANLCIGLDSDDSWTYIKSSQVKGAAAELWKLSPQHVEEFQQWFQEPDTFDFSIGKIVTDLHDVVAGVRDGFDLLIRISNTEDCRSTGTHWFTIAYSVQIAGGDSAALVDVRANVQKEIERQERKRRVQEEIERQERQRRVAPGGST